MILSVDQGTSSTKATLFDQSGTAVTSATVPLGQAHPRPGWVEQDAGEILAGVRSVVDQMAAAHPVDAVALSTQRESALVWNRATGEPVGPMLGWQDRRTAHRVAELADHAGRVRQISGLPLDPMFSALKLQWLLDTVDPDRSRSRRGELAVGTVDSWLVTSLTGDHRIEAGNASRTQLLDLATGEWSEELCELFDIPREVLPRVAASDEATGDVEGLPGRQIRAVLGDSHAALYGHGVRGPGALKATYGTGSSVMGLVDHAAQVPKGLVGTVAWRLGDRLAVGIEGNILASGATVAWLSRLLGRSVEELAAMARTAPADHGVTLVPAVAGLGAPHWDPTARAVLVGFDLGTDPGVLARAAMEAIAHQITDVVDAAEAAGPVEAILADGAPAADDFLMQLQADIGGRTVRRPRYSGLSARGAAQLAADTLGGGFTPVDSDTFLPVKVNTTARSTWASALSLTQVRD
ncbi:FGGY family carbohydrate kinase [Tessaracoccus lapidicaptus]|uniref:FGGY family carbohydrate kinase n=1 Tax=Tessaracoccus lapidicaptus TaxID=1427523 RepID=UPI00333EF6B3